VIACRTLNGDNALLHPLPEPLVELVAQRFRVLGEPMRIRLLDRLGEGDATVSELHAALGASQQNVSKHLGVLLRAGMVTRSKHGTSARYAIADEGVFKLCDDVCGGLRRQVSELDALLPVAAPRPSREHLPESAQGVSGRSTGRRSNVR
jgi:DNA-binding transcriptional ArsR family regulator